MPSSFWAGGPNAYYESLKQQYNLQRKALQDQLRECASDLQRDEIRARMKAAKEAFKEKVRTINKQIF